MRMQKKFFNDYAWKKNPNAVYVGRPSKWGNPFKVSEYGRKECLRKYRGWLLEKLGEDPAFLEPLRGKDLVCFCPLNKPCHADIITEVLRMLDRNKNIHYLTNYLNVEASQWINPNIFKRGLRH